MTKAKYHVGIDSGFLHLSQVYFAPQDIHIYTTSPNKWSPCIEQRIMVSMKIQVEVSVGELYDKISV